ncbi:MAG: adenylate/guanylate cyclase domain-containing response regulator [Cyanobacteria bacterium]|nr:adenylate/guanylate cyclase domain-containing response regulator [Cyanobacteriota bacterium]
MIARLRGIDPRIAIATTCPATAEALASVVKALTPQVHLTTDFDAIAALVDQVKPDALLLDLAWGDASYDLCRRLTTPQEPSQPPPVPEQRTLHGHPIPLSKLADAGPPVVLLLGQRLEQIDRDRVFQCGAADYLLAPFSPQETLTRLGDRLNLRRLERSPLMHPSHYLMHNNRPIPLLVELQKRMRKQATILQENLLRLAQEVEDRRQAEAALRLEQERSEKLLLNILPQAIVQRLKEREGSIAEGFEQATVLFADLVDFTPLSARMAPMELVDLLNQIFSTFDRTVEELGLEKIKTIGDAYMVVGGVPIPRADHAEAVMELAIAMRKTVRQFRQQTGHPLRIRIGINTGPVVAGVIGIKKFSYDLWGDAVNVASRMESQGLPGRIQLAESTYQLLQDRYEFERWSNLNVKGKGRMTTYLYVRRTSETALEAANEAAEGAGDGLPDLADSTRSPQPLPARSPMP